MIEWLYEDGIGERRAALVEDGRIIAMRVERDSDGLRVGAILPGRLVSGRERLARTDDGDEVYLASVPPLPDGSKCQIRITRAAIPERDLVKRPRGEIPMNAEGGADLREKLLWRGATLREIIDQAHDPVRQLARTGADGLEEAGWSEAVDEARTGIMPFDGGVLRLAVTPAMSVFDVDGSLPPLDLALAGAKAVARQIVRLGIGGNIVIDLPGIRRRDQRNRIGEAFDAELDRLARYRPVPTERMPINALGLLHLTRERSGPSIAERVQFAPVESAALALLRRAERAVGTGPLALTAHPAITGWLAARPELTGMLARRTGRTPVLQVDPGLSICAGHAQ